MPARIAGGHPAEWVLPGEHLDVDLGAYACALMERPRAERWSPDAALWREQEAEAASLRPV